ncbi:DUF475 domain-containing protein [Pararhizobium mangrovi]|uniref:DUF475 domain-containing protein n=1 Tax=Pararhizobium mangrovi TaxID=2590452 RepID=A0A506UA13_9HYPH|nr:DUF475 domain-containing protein [Pararhizobium mangrovi]TPW29904.1 DUF475 domain-containing protein [Pararhizobium mangrovi]
MSIFRVYLVAVIVTVVGLALGGWIGYVYKDTVSGAASTLLICIFLAVLEISLSFDNAIVNARILRGMSETWQKRFLTWGILIAVFGMRIVFPLAIVSIAAWIDPIAAVRMAIMQPQQYSHVMEQAHLGIAAFGGAFLMMVALTFFLDRKKDVHWLGFLERPLVALGKVRAVEAGITLALLMLFAMPLTGDDWNDFVGSGVWGVVTFLVVEGAGKWIDESAVTSTAGKAGLGAFLYLEMLDASFSFDGVVGAFAISNNLFVIAIGLGIGAFYIRSMTIMLVERGTLAQYRYIEHGAFYAILVLAIIMFAQAELEIPEYVTGLAGATLIALAFFSSVRYRRRHGDEAEAAAEPA